MTQLLKATLRMSPIASVPIFRQAQLERSQYKRRLMAKEFFPDYRLGVEYRTFRSSEDMVMFTVGFDLPIWLSKNRAGVREAEKMIESELGVASLALQEDLAHTLGLLASYQGDPEVDIARVAHAEVAYPDPVRARLAGSRSDPLGIGSVFASAAHPR